MNDLTCRYLPRLDGAPAPALARLFPEPSTTAPMLSLLQESGIDGFNLGSIVVFQAEAPILLWPLFETRLDVSAVAQGRLKKALQAAGRLIPQVFRPLVLCLGSVDGQWSEMGIDPRIDAGTLDAASKMAFARLQKVAVEHQSDVLALYNFNQYGGLPGDLLTGFNRVPFRPCARLTIDFSSVEQYLSRLPRGSRKQLRRKMRVAPEVRILRCSDIAPFLGRIYTLYRDTVARSPMPLGKHNRLYFEKICQRVPGAEYVLYFLQEELVAFNLLFIKQEEMVDKFFCMEYDPGSKFNLYALSWLENVRTCVERHIPFYYAGQGAEETKAHLGASFIPSYLLFRHRWRLFDRLLTWPQALTGKLLSRLGLWPSVLPVAPELPVAKLQQQIPGSPGPAGAAGQAGRASRAPGKGMSNRLLH
jgi:hypothetical protein